MELPIIPPLPSQPAPSLAERLQHQQLVLYREDLLQRAAVEAAAAERHQAWLAETREVERRHRERQEQEAKCTEATNKQREVMERILTEGMPLDKPSADALEAVRVAVDALRTAIAGWQPVAGGGIAEREDRKLSEAEVDLAVKLVKAARD